MRRLAWCAASAGWWLDGAPLDLRLGLGRASRLLVAYGRGGQ